MVKRFLITTALEESWREDEPVLFLGEWCRRHTRRDRWSAMDAEVLPYHWDDRAKLSSDYRYLLDLHERLLADVAAQLNGLHGVEHGLRYWRILIGPWLGYFTQMLFDRWTSIRQATEKYDLSGTLLLDAGTHASVPNDMADFTTRLWADECNHQLYASIIRQFTAVPFETRTLVRATGESAAPSGWKQRMQGIVAAAYQRLAAHAARDTDAFQFATYLRFGDEMRVCRHLRQVPLAWRSDPPVRVPVDVERRRWVVPGNDRNEFERCARVLIPQHMPAAYLEGYTHLLGKAASMSWPGRPKVIWTSNAHISDDVFKAWAADKVEQGAPLVIGQHGGHYGVGQWTFVEDHEVAISDRYLTWGWSEPGQPNLKPVGRLTSTRPSRVRHAGQPHALLVTCTLPRFSYWMYSVPVARQWLDYFSEQCAFVAHLPQPIQDALIVRLFARDGGWDQLSRWRERFPRLRLDEGTSRIGTLIRRSRLYISTYNATTYLESFALGIPTVIYWNPGHWELRDSAVPYFEELHRVGIFHETPESAARHVTAVWNDVGKWWFSSAVQDVLGRFKERYCFLPNDLPRSVAGALRESMAVSTMAAAR